MLTSMHQFINSRELPSHLPLPSLASLSLDHNKCKSFSAAVIIIVNIININIIFNNNVVIININIIIHRERSPV